MKENTSNFFSHDELTFKSEIFMEHIHETYKKLILL